MATVKFRPLCVFLLVLLLALPATLALGACSGAKQELSATYLGVEDYGAPQTNKDNKESFRYRFDANGQERVFLIDNGEKDADGNCQFPLQNKLKEGYTYTIVVEDDTVVSAEEKMGDQATFTPVIAGTPGEKTVLNFLKTAVMPVGTTLYIYGGGWDWQDVGSSIQARTIGVSPDWVRFFQSQDASFTYKEKDGKEENADPYHSYYPYGEYNEYYYAGLDCSGYVGWALYNTLETESGEEGYVCAASGMGQSLVEKGWGTLTKDVPAPQAESAEPMKPGDIMCMDGHVWISLGTCSDGSVVIAHSTPSASRSGQPGGGVQIGAIGTDESCEAYKLADHVMKSYYPEWSARYPTALKDPSVYFTFEEDEAGRFTWDASQGSTGLTDPEGVQSMEPAKVLALIGFETQ